MFSVHLWKRHAKFWDCCRSFVGCGNGDKKVFSQDADLGIEVLLKFIILLVVLHIWVSTSYQVSIREVLLLPFRKDGRYVDEMELCVLPVMHCNLAF